MGRRKHASAFSRRIAPELCQKLPALMKSEGAGNAGCALHPRSRVRLVLSRLHTSIQGSGGHPTFPAQWLYGLYRALPGRAGLVVTVAGGIASANLTPASGRQDHTTSPYASAPFVKGASASTASHPALVTIAKRPSYRDGTKSIYC